jgi:hypothetical protein
MKTTLATLRILSEKTVSDEADTPMHPGDE